MVTIGSRLQRGVVIRTLSASGEEVRPAFMDIIPRYRQTEFADNQQVVVNAAASWPRLGFVCLQDPTAWWAIAEWSGVIDPFEELVEGATLQAPSLTRYHLGMLLGDEDR